MKITWYLMDEPKERLVRDAEGRFVKGQTEAEIEAAKDQLREQGVDVSGYTAICAKRHYLGVKVPSVH